MSEKELISSYQETRNIELLGTLYKQYSRLIFGVCMKYLKNTADAEDASMEVFELLVRYLVKTTPADFKSWLFVTTKNHCLLLLKKKSKEQSLRNNMVQEFIEITEENTLTEKRLDQLDEAVRTLNDPQRTAIVLFYFNQLSYKDISEKMNWTFDQTKSYLQNGKRALGLFLKKKSSHVR